MFKHRIYTLPDPCSDSVCYIAFLGNYPIPSRGRNKETFLKPGSQLTFADVCFVTMAGCNQNTQWYQATYLIKEISDE